MVYRCFVMILTSSNKVCHMKRNPKASDAAKSHLATSNDIVELLGGLEKVRFHLDMGIV